jgi:hypothetical protein
MEANDVGVLRRLMRKFSLSLLRAKNQTVADDVFR